MIILSTQEMATLLPMEKAIDLVAKALISASSGKAKLPLRHAMEVEAPNMLGIMPGVMDDPACFGIKLISLYPNNPAHGYSSHLGLMLLFEKQHGTPIAMMNAGLLTAIRTSAASAVATNLLARKDASVLTVIGCGEQGEFHIHAMLAVRSIKEVRVVGRCEDKLEIFVAKMRENHAGIGFYSSTNAQEVVRGTDIICTVTSSKEVVLKGAWIDEGCHINAVGASIPIMREIDEDVVAMSSLYVDYRPSAFAQSGDILGAIETGRITKDHVIGEIGELLENKVRGRETQQEITLFRSLGIASEDLICAHSILEAAKREGMGTVADIL